MSEIVTLHWDALFLMLVFFFMNGFFVAAEFAIVTVRRTKIEGLAQKGSATAKKLIHILDNQMMYLNATQVGITFASIGIGWVAEPFFEALIIKILEFVRLLDFVNKVTTVQSFYIIVSIISLTTVTFIHVVVSENLPKFIALDNSEKLAIFLTLPIIYFTKLIKPILFFLNNTTDTLLEWFSIERRSDHLKGLTIDEIKRILDYSHQHNLIEEDYHKLIYGVLQLTDLTARDIMTPRPFVKAIPIDATYEEIIEIATETGFSRFPVYENELDNIQGIFHVKNLISYWNKPNEFSVKNEMREKLVIPESKSIHGLLEVIKQSQNQLAVVVDEFGVVSGIVTLEDVIEELIGPIDDEFDKDEIEEIQETENGYIIKGETHLEDINHRFGTKMEANGVITIGGYLIESVDHIPKEGEHITILPWDYEILKTEHNRIILIKATPIEEKKQKEEINNKKKKKKKRENKNKREEEKEEDV